MKEHHHFSCKTKESKKIQDDSRQEGAKAEGFSFSKIFSDPIIPEDESKLPHSGMLKAFLQSTLSSLSTSIQATADYYSSTANSASGNTRKDRNNLDPTMFYMDCDQLVVEMDTLYVSKDMDIVVSLRSSDLQSMLPDLSVRMSEVVFEGVVRLKMQLTADYPFFGNATVSIQFGGFTFSIFLCFYVCKSTDVVYEGA